MNDLKSIKAGDEVILWNGGFEPYPRFVFVKKVHKLRIVAAGRMFRKCNGSEIRGYGHIRVRTSDAVKTMNEALADLKIKQLARSLRDFPWHKRPIDVLNQVANIIGINK